MVVFLAVHLVYLLVTLLLEAASGGAIGLVHDDDIIEIDIPNRSINLKISDEELAKRRTEQDAKGWQPITVNVKCLCIKSIWSLRYFCG